MLSRVRQSNVSRCIRQRSLRLFRGEVAWGEAEAQGPNPKADTLDGLQLGKHKGSRAQAGWDMRHRFLSFHVECRACAEGDELMSVCERTWSAAQQTMLAWWAEARRARARQGGVVELVRKSLLQLATRCFWSWVAFLHSRQKTAQSFFIVNEIQGGALVSSCYFTCALVCLLCGILVVSCPLFLRALV
jgi:hypothetical protein